MLTFAFVPLPALARDSRRIRSLGLRAQDFTFLLLPVGDNPCRVFPEPFSECGSRIRARRIGDPRRGSPTAKLSTGLFLLPFLRFAVAYPSRTPAGVLSGDFAACGLRRGLLALDLVSLLKKAQAKTFRFYFLRACACREAAKTF